MPDMDPPPVFGKRIERPSAMRPLLSAHASQQLQSGTPSCTSSSTAPSFSALKIPLLEQSSASTLRRVRAKTAEIQEQKQQQQQQQDTPPSSIPLKRAVTPGASLQQRSTQHEEDWTTPWQDQQASQSTPASPTKRPPTGIEHPMTPMPTVKRKKRECPETIVFNEMRALRDENTRLQTALTMGTAVQEASRQECAALHAQLLEQAGKSKAMQERLAVNEKQAEARQRTVAGLKERILQLTASFDPTLLGALRSDLSRFKENTTALTEEVQAHRAETDRIHAVLHATQANLQRATSIIKEQEAAIREFNDEKNKLLGDIKDYEENATITAETIATQEKVIIQNNTTLAEIQEQHRYAMMQKDKMMFGADEIMLTLATLQEGQQKQAQQLANIDELRQHVQQLKEALAQAKAELAQQQRLSDDQLHAQAKEYEARLSAPNAEVTALQQKLANLEALQSEKSCKEKEALQYAHNVTVMDLENNLQQSKTAITKLELQLQTKEAVIVGKQREVMTLENLAKQHETRLIKMEKELKARDKEEGREKKPSQEKEKKSSQDKRSDKDVIPETQDISSDPSVMRKVMFTFDEGEAKPRRLGYKRRK